jgi:hypothetical protein
MPASVRTVSGMAADIIALAVTRTPTAISDKRFMSFSPREIVLNRDLSRFDGPLG